MKVVPGLVVRYDIKECLECDAEWNEKNGGGLCARNSPMMLDMMWMKDEAAQSWTQRTR